MLRHHAFPILSREKPHCCSHCCWCAGLMREMMLLLPELWQSCLLRDKVQLLENKQHVQSKLSAAMHSRENSSEPQTHRDFFTLRLQQGNPVFCLKVMWFMAFGMCSKALTCHMWPPARLCKHPSILLCRYSCLQMEGDVVTNQK